MLFWPSEEGFWPLSASIPSKVKNNYVHATMEGILIKIRGLKFSVGCMVWQRQCKKCKSEFGIREVANQKRTGCIVKMFIWTNVQQCYAIKIGHFA